MNKRTTLILNGQISRNLATNNLIDIIKYHEDFIPHNDIICHLWDDELALIKNVNLPINVKIKVSNKLIPFSDKEQPYINPHEIAFHAESIRISNNENNILDQYIDSAKNSFKQIYGLETAFNFALNNTESQIFIRSRYDNLFQFKLNFDELYDYLKSEKPVTMVPKTNFNSSLIDTFFVMNKSSISTFQNYLDDCVSYSKKHRVFWPENSLRYHLINMKKSDVYRFNFPNTTHRWLKNNNQFHVNNFPNSKITKDIKKFDFRGVNSANYII